MASLLTLSGMGVGSLSMIVPMYNAEIAPPEVRGALVGLQQLSITLGIMISFWIDYGTVSHNILNLALRKLIRAHRTSLADKAEARRTPRGSSRWHCSSSPLSYSVLV
jgi:MFS family permease